MSKIKERGQEAVLYYTYVTGFRSWRPTYHTIVVSICAIIVQSKVTNSTADTRLSVGCQDQAAGSQPQSMKPIINKGTAF